MPASTPAALKPAGAVTSTTGSGQSNRRMTEAISDRARDAARKHRFNFYKRARLGNRVKWALKEAGYPDEFVTAFTTELITLVTVAGRS